MNKLAFLDSVRQGIKGMVDKGYNAVNVAAKSLTKDNISPSTGRPESGGLSLDQLGNKYHDNLVYGLAGTAVGGGIGALTTDTEEDKTFGDKLRHRLRNALTGGIAGGAVGIGGKTFFDDYIKKPKLPERPAPIAGGIGKKLDNFFGLNKNNKDLTVEQVANRARAESAAKPGATPQSIDADVKAAVEATTAPLGAKDEIVAILNPASGSEVGRTAAGALITAGAGEVVLRHNNKIPGLTVSDDVSKRMEAFKSTRMDNATDALKAPNAESPYRKGWSTKRLTNQQALNEMIQLRDSPNPGTRALKRYNIANRIPIGKGPRALQILSAVAAGFGANQLGKPHE